MQYFIIYEFSRRYVKSHMSLCDLNFLKPTKSWHFEINFRENMVFIIFNVRTTLFPILSLSVVIVN